MDCFDCVRFRCFTASSQGWRAITVPQIGSRPWEWSTLSCPWNSHHRLPTRGSRRRPLCQLAAGHAPVSKLGRGGFRRRSYGTRCGCAASASAPTASGKSTAGLTVTQGRQATSTASQGIRALGISLGLSDGAAGPGSPGAPTSSPSLVPGSLASTDPSVAFGLNPLDGIAAGGETVYLAN